MAVGRDLGDEAVVTAVVARVVCARPGREARGARVPGHVGVARRVRVDGPADVGAARAQECRVDDARIDRQRLRRIVRAQREAVPRAALQPVPDRDVDPPAGDRLPRHRGGVRQRAARRVHPQAPVTRDRQPRRARIGQADHGRVGARRHRELVLQLRHPAGHRDIDPRPHAVIRQAPVGRQRRLVMRAADVADRPRRTLGRRQRRAGRGADEVQLHRVAVARDRRAAVGEEEAGVAGVCLVADPSVRLPAVGDERQRRGRCGEGCRRGGRGRLPRTGAEDDGERDQSRRDRRDHCA